MPWRKKFVYCSSVLFSLLQYLLKVFFWNLSSKYVFLVKYAFFSGLPYFTLWFDILCSLSCSIVLLKQMEILCLFDIYQIMKMVVMSSVNWYVYLEIISINLTMKWLWFYAWCLRDTKSNSLFFFLFLHTLRSLDPDAYLHDYPSVFT